MGPVFSAHVWGGGVYPHSNMNSSKYFHSGACTVTPVYAWLSWSYSQVTAYSLPDTFLLLCLFLDFPADCRFCISILIFCFVFQTIWLE